MKIYVVTKFGGKDDDFKKLFFSSKISAFKFMLKDSKKETDGKGEKLTMNSKKAYLIDFLDINLGYTIEKKTLLE